MECRYKLKSKGNSSKVMFTTGKGAILGRISIGSMQPIGVEVNLRPPEMVLTWKKYLDRARGIIARIAVNILVMVSAIYGATVAINGYSTGGRNERESDR